METMNQLVFFGENEQMVTSSLIVAEVFGKEHRTIIRTIKNLTAQNCAVKTMFDESTYTNSRNQEQPIYYMNRDGFTLLAMGFTGKKALEFKLRYIEAFNKMELHIRNIEAKCLEADNEKWSALALNMTRINKRLDALEKGHRGVGRKCDKGGSHLGNKAVDTIRTYLSTLNADRVCARQIQEECFGTTRLDVSRSINQVLEIEGWMRLQRPSRFAGYGVQRGFIRNV